MNDPSFSEEIAYFLPFDLTPAQEEATECLSLFFADQSPYTVCLIKGYAGTGKTALLGARSVRPAKGEAPVAKNKTWL